MVGPCPDARFGDYQTNALMGFAKERRRNPRQLAEEVRVAMEVGDWCEAVEVAGAGFLNFRLRAEAVASELASALAGEHLFFAPAERPRRLVIDFSSPNVAKPMHVGHIRSTILGDCLARTFRRLGHRVVTDNHIGDWGTQFGKLIVGWKRYRDDAALDADPLGEMDRLYKRVNRESESDPEVMEAARAELVKLQAGDPENRRIWEEMIAMSQAQFNGVYRRLGVQFDQALGESFYNDRLQGLVDELLEAEIAELSEGAVVVFFPEHPVLKSHPAMIRKRDGAANYATTDLATLEYRYQTWSPNEIVYVTDGRQQLHFQQIFEIFQRWKPKASVTLRHVWFGAILGEDGKPFKTRTGETVRLVDLLDEAQERALRVVREKNPELPPEEQSEIARCIGIGAIKYADLLPNRQSDYQFSWDKMLSLNGNTAPYLLYACTRIRSIFRKCEAIGIPANPAPEEILGTDTPLGSPEELILAKKLLNFGLTIERVVAECRPNYLCNYLYELAGAFAKFYEQCPVLKAAPSERPMRLALCQLTDRVLHAGLDLLGIETTDKM